MVLISVGVPAVALLLDVPVAPGRDEARAAAERELSQVQYADPVDPVARALEWFSDLLWRLFDNATGVTAGWPPELTVAAVVLVVAVLVAVVVWRAGGLGRTSAGRRAGLLDDVDVPAGEYRARAEAAAAAGDLGTALVERFRAAVRQAEEAGRLTARRGRTADEAAREIAEALPGTGPLATAAAGHFDAVRYGARVADAARYGAVVQFDEALAVALAAPAPAGAGQGPRAAVPA